MMKKLVLLLLCGMLVCHGRVWYVSENGDDSRDGSSWDMALKSPQVAIERGESGDEVWVSQGTYRATWLRETEGGQLFAASFKLKSGVSIYGGFIGTENSRDGRQIGEDGLYQNQTILESTDACPGTVLYGGTEAFEVHTVLDGLVLRNGNACGKGLDGQGGGACLPGNCELSRCLVTGNQAIQGGGIYANGTTAIRQCIVFGNDVAASGMSGCGGGIYAENGVTIENCLIRGNGKNGVVSGGGCYLVDGCTLRHCTIVDNGAMQSGSGCVMAGENCLLENSVIWGNQGPASQVEAGSGQAKHCAVEGQELVGENIRLASANCGTAGVEANENKVGLYYPCFQDTAQGDYHLGAGSYLINRGVDSGLQWTLDNTQRNQQGIPDIGCYESHSSGNLAVAFSVASPCVYGEVSALKIVAGSCSPTVSGYFYGVDGGCSISGSAEAWQLTMLRAGEVGVKLEAFAVGGAWNTCNVEQTVSVEKRPLMIVAEDAESRYGEELPEFQWTLTRGQLMPGDSITGKLACDIGTETDVVYSITQGTLAVQDGNGGNNYSVLFVEGELEYGHGVADITTEGEVFEYNGNSRMPQVQVDPAVSYTTQFDGVDGTVYGPSDTAPIDAGTYKMTVTLTGAGYKGSLEANYRIEPAVLRVVADDKMRSYGAENPVLTATYTGWQGKDNVSCITEPVLSTDAEQNSPVGSYPIHLTGGSARNYRLVYEEGVLTISQAGLTGEVTASGVTYGDALSSALLSGQMMCQNEVVSGTFELTEAGQILASGTHRCHWRFIPQDYVNYAIAEGEVDIQVAKRHIVIQPEDKEQVYGEAAVALSYSLADGSTLVQGDALNVTLSRQAGLGVGQYKITAVCGATSNYDVECREGTYRITRRPLVLQAEDKAQVYGEAAVELTYVLAENTSLVQGDTLDVTLSRTAGDAVGEYPISIVCNNGNNYAVETRGGTYRIGKRHIVIQAENKTQVYGEAPVALSYSLENGSSLAAGDALNVILAREPGENAGTYRISVTGIGNDNYTFEGIDGVYQITPRAVTVRAEDKSKLYGEADETLTYAVVSGSVIDGDELPVNLHREAGEAVGDYDINVETWDGGNYQVTGEAGRYHIGKQTIVLAVKSVTKAWQEEDPEWEIVVEEGTLASWTSIQGEVYREPGEDMGKYVLHGDQLTVSEAEGYELTVKDGTLTIGKGQIALENNGEGVETCDYGEYLHDVTMTEAFLDANTGETIPGTVRWEPEDTDLKLPGGDDYVFIRTFVPTDRTHYDVLRWEAKVCVNKLPLTVTISPLKYTREAYVKNPTYSLSYSGFIDGENVKSLDNKGWVKCDADYYSAIGTYTVTVEGFESSNYYLVVEPATLTIQPRSYTGEAVASPVRGAQSEEKGNNTLATSTISTWFYTFPDGQTVTGRAEWDAARNDPNTTYPCAGNTTFYAWFIPDDLEHFEKRELCLEVDYINTKLRVKLLPSSGQGALPGVETQETYQWQVNENDAANLGFVPNVDNYVVFAREAGNKPGTYRYWVAEEDYGNSGFYFVFDTTEAYYEVLPRSVTIEPQSVSKVYGEADPEIPYVVTGDVPDGYHFNLKLSREAGENVGSYQVTLGELEQYQDTYSITLVPATVTITPRSITIQADDAVAEYGDDMPEATFKITSGSLAGNDQFTIGEQAPQYLLPGTHDITLEHVSLNENYTLTRLPGQLTVSNRKVTIQADDMEKTVGADDPELTYSVISGSFAPNLVVHGSLNREAGEEVGEYAITDTNLQYPAYHDVTFLSGTFRIVPSGMLAMSAPASSSAYCDPIVVSAAGDGDVRTLDEALDYVEDGWRIQVMPGTYASDIWLVGKSVTIEGILDANGNKPVLNGCINLNGAEASGCTLSNLAIASETGPAIVVGYDCGRTTIRQCKIGGRNVGVLADNQDITLEENSFTAPIQVFYTTPK